MPYTKFTQALLENGTLRVSGPFGFASQEEPMHVATLGFVLIQGDQLVHGTGGADEPNWSGTASPVKNLKPGRAQAFGTMLLVRTGPSPAYETFSWTDEVTLQEI